VSNIYERLRPLKLLGSLLEVVRIFFRKDGFKIEWKPNQSHTYAADMTYEFPAPDAATTTSDILVSENSQQTITNKTINFNPLVGGNTAQDVPLSAMKTDNTQANKIVMRDGSGVMTHGQVAESQLESTLSDKINAKAEQSDVETLQDDVTTLTSAVAAKASNNTVNALDARVAVLEEDPVTKTYVDDAVTNAGGGNVDLSGVEGRLDVLESDPVTKTYVDNELSGKASQASVTSLQSDVTTLQGYQYLSATWTPQHGTTRTITHNKNWTQWDVCVLNSNNERIYVDSIIPNGVNAFVLTSSVAPDANWTIVYRKL
jgi:hypothetical protein